MITNATSYPSTAGGGFNDNVCEVVEKAISQPEGQPARQSLTRPQEDANTWTCPPILIDVAESLTNDGILQKIDIAETILGREGRSVPSSKKRNDDNCYWLAKKFNIDEFREKEIAPEIKAICRAAGFKVICQYRKTAYGGNGSIEVKCCRGKYHSVEKTLVQNRKKARTAKSNAAPKTRKKKSMKPILGQDGNDTRCPFQFQIFWDEKRKRWFLPKIQRGNRVHCGHKQIDPADIKLRTKNSISPVEKEKITEDSLQSHISTAATLNPKVNNLNQVDVDESDQNKLTARFLPRYVDICDYAQSIGENGIAVMTKHFDHCQRRFLNFIYNATISEDQVAAPKPAKSGSVPYVRFKTPFEAICQMAQQTGEAGIEVFSEELLACKQELVSLVGGKS